MLNEQTNVCINEEAERGVGEGEREKPEKREKEAATCDRRGDHDITLTPLSCRGRRAILAFLSVLRGLLLRGFSFLLFLPPS